MPKKCYSVSGIKNNVQRHSAFNSKKKAEKVLQSVEFQKGWKDLGISSGSCKQERKIEKFIGKKIIYNKKYKRLD